MEVKVEILVFTWWGWSTVCSKNTTNTYQSFLEKLAHSRNGSWAYHRYIQQFLEYSSFSASYYHQHDTLVCVLGSTLKHSFIMRFMAKLQIKERLQTYSLVDFSACERTKATIYNPKSHFACNFITSHIVKQIIGHILQIRTVSHTNFCYRSWYFCSDIFGFNLDSRLSLNMTFQRIYFNSGSFDCCKGSLIVTRTGFPHDITTFYNSVKNSTQTFMFCGFTPKFALFPNFQTIFLIRSSQEYTLFDFSLTFQVLDRNTVHSKSQSPARPDYKMIEVTFHTQHLLVQCVAIVQVNKAGYMIIVLRGHGHVRVHDGPGQKSKTVDRFANKYITSSFLCYVTFGTKHVDSKFPHSLLKYSRRMLKVVKIIYVKENTTTLPIFLEETSGTHVIQLKRFDQKNINVTITSLNYTGNKDDLGCIYGGVAALKGTRKNLKEQLSICTTLDIARSLYSSSENLTLVIYQYKFYSSIKITLSLSLTECQAFKINDCVYAYLCNCIETQIEALCGNRNVHKGRCDDFLDSLGPGVDRLKPVYQHEGTTLRQRQEIGQLQFIMRPNSCIIIQLFRREHDLLELRKELTQGKTKPDPPMAGCDTQIVLGMRGQPFNMYFKFEAKGSLIPRSAKYYDDLLLSKGTEEVEVYGQQVVLHHSSGSSYVAKKKLVVWERFSGRWNRENMDLFYDNYILLTPTVAFSSVLASKQHGFSVHGKAYPIASHDNLVIFMRLLPQVFQSWVEVVFRKKSLDLLKMEKPKMKPFDENQKYFFGDECLFLLKLHPHKHSEPSSDQIHLIHLGFEHTFPDSLKQKDSFLSSQLHAHHSFLSIIFAALSKKEVFPVLLTGELRQFNFSGLARTGRNLSLVLTWVTDYPPNCRHSTLQQIASEFECETHSSRHQNYFNVTCRIPQWSNSSAYLLFGVKHVLTQLVRLLKAAEKELRQRRLSSSRSWFSASQLCFQHNAVLPVFTSRTDLEWFLLLTKNSYQFPLMEAIYIGLYFDSAKVSGISASIWLLQ